MRSAPAWIRRVVVGGVSTLTACTLGFVGLLSEAQPAGATSSFGITQIAGANRFATAAAIAAAAFPSGAATVVVANGLATNLSDSLAASYLAAQENGGGGAPILLVNPDSLPPETASALVALKAKNVVIVGGTGAVDATVATALANSGKVTVTRVGGADRFATADAVDSQLGMTKVGTVGNKRYAVVADGQDANLVDALGASAVAYAGPFPLLLVNGATAMLSSADLAVLKADAITDVVLVGGTAAIGSQLATQLTAVGVASVEEGGANRSATSFALADYAINALGFSSGRFDIASGDPAHLVDSLAAGPFGGAIKAPTLITSSVNDPGSATNFATEHAATESLADLIGGSGSVDATAEAAIVAAARAGQTPPTGPPTLTAAKLTATVAATSASSSSGGPAAGTTVQYVFNQNVAADTLKAGAFHVYTASDGEGSATSAVVDPTNANAVDALFTTAGSADLTTAVGAAALALATVGGSGDGAVGPAVTLPISGLLSSNPSGANLVISNPDGSEPIGSATSSVTPGTVAAPQLKKVALITAATGSGATGAVFYFTQPVTNLMVGGLHLYDLNRTALTCTTAAALVAGGDSVTCTAFTTDSAGFPAASAAQVAAAVLGTADSGAVTGPTAPNANKNPEGAFS